MFCYYEKMEANRSQQDYTMRTNAFKKKYAEYYSIWNHIRTINETDYNSLSDTARANLFHEMKRYAVLHRELQFQKEDIKAQYSC